VTLPSAAISISSSSCSMVSSSSAMADADLDGLVLGDVLVDDAHLALLELAHHPVVDVVLGHAADERLAQLAELVLGEATSLHAESEGAAGVAAEDRADAVALDHHLLADRPRALQDLG